MKFAIPSYNRYETLNKKSLFFLLRHKVDKKDIYLFIREDDKDLAGYQGLGCNVIITPPHYAVMHIILLQNILMKVNIS